MTYPLRTDEDISITPIGYYHSPYSWQRMLYNKNAFSAESNPGITPLHILLCIPKATILDQDIAEIVDKALVACEKEGHKDIRKDVAIIWACYFRKVKVDRKWKVVLKEVPKYTSEDAEKFEDFDSWKNQHIFTTKNSITDCLQHTPQTLKRKRVCYIHIL